MFVADTTPVDAATSASASEPLHLWKQIVEPVESFLGDVAAKLGEQVQTFHPEIAPFARYALTNQGKQLRPALVALSARAAGRLNENLVTVAVIIEMVHLATLVHDDVMDEASMRRQRPTVAANWGNHVSVLLGDCLFAHALKLASGFPTTEVCRAVSAATKTVCSGEILQTLRRGKVPPSRSDYFKVLEMKTAELFALSCELGAWMSGAAPAECAALRQYGLKLGTAYQIYDDCVDLFGSEAEVGKSLGTDLASGKLTLPVIVALERCSPGERARLEGWVEHWRPEDLGALLDLLRACDATGESRRTVHQFIAAARAALEDLPASDGRRALSNLADFLAQQTGALGV
jgi:octaprenyl-diphosphate synthase